MLVQTIPIPEPLTLSASALTREAFAPFGDVIANPRPECRPSNTSPEAISRGDLLPCGAVSANQGTAIQYRRIATRPTPQNLYSSAPSGRPATARTTMFVCGARTLLSSSSSSSSGKWKGEGGGGGGGVEIKVLERHPFTSQTFIPLTADKSKRYLVVVAPTLASPTKTEKFPVPQSSSADGIALPGPGLPDLPNLRAFIATAEQAVTYGTGTWHAPMIALGPPDSTIDFVVVQFANDIPVEDCQEVALESAGAVDAKGEGEARGIFVRVPPQEESEGRMGSKL
ncbi:ureidoglycolate hydrolase [Xylariaceae sp. FL0594]|nr:ureidoglycolate hydrolase [Xylariaceae sp. FL0594]